VTRLKLCNLYDDEEELNPIKHNYIKERVYGATRANNGNVFGIKII
jgi:hypothetical protein